MVHLSLEEIESLARNVLGSLNEISPIGNHHLCRHLVFKVENDFGVNYVLKIYYKKGSRDCERAALDELAFKDVKTTTIVDYGEYLNHEWVLYDYIEGTLLDNVIDEISPIRQREIFNELGEIFAKMHEQDYDAIGLWNANGEIISPIFNRKLWMKDHASELIKEMHRQDFQNNDQIKQLCDTVESIDYEFFDEASVSLVHFDLDGRNIIVDPKNDSYQLNGIIDFESSKPWFRDRSFVPLYFRYFYDRKDLKDEFWMGYRKINENNLCIDNVIEVYLQLFVLSNLTWSKLEAPSYYYQNLQFLSEKLLKSS